LLRPFILLALPACLLFTPQVRYTCTRGSKDNVVLSVREFPTCNYVVVVSTPFLCKHPFFQPPVRPSVSCCKQTVVRQYLQQHGAVLLEDNCRLIQRRKKAKVERSTS
jgi:hypothetical protein